MSQGTISSASNQYQAHRSKELLQQVQELVALAQFGYKKSIPKNTGANQITFYTPDTVTSSNVITPTEGTPINVFTDCTHSTTTATLVQYISQKQRSDLRDATEYFDFHDQAIKDLGYEFSEKKDDLSRDVLNAETTGLTIRRANGAATWTALNSDTSTSTASIVDFLASVTQLRINRARPIDNDGCYVAVCPPQIEYDLMKTTSTSAVTWFDVNKYNDATKIFKGEMGKVFGCRFVMTTNPFEATGSATAGDEYVYDTTGDGGVGAGSTIYSSYILGDQAFGIPDLSGMGSMSPRIYIVDTPDSANPALQFKTISGKMYYTTVVLNPNFGIALKTKSSQNFTS